MSSAVTDCGQGARVPVLAVPRQQQAPSGDRRGHADGRRLAVPAIVPDPAALQSPVAAGPGLIPPVPLERLRLLTTEQRWQALIFLAGWRPREVDLAILAAQTPLSSGIWGAL